VIGGKFANVVCFDLLGCFGFVFPAEEKSDLVAFFGFVLACFFLVKFLSERKERCSRCSRQRCLERARHPSEVKRVKKKNSRPLCGTSLEHLVS